VRHTAEEEGLNWAKLAEFLLKYGFPDEIVDSTIWQRQRQPW
jgi:hypothetical protein